MQDTFSMYNIIRNKRDHQELTADEIQWVIESIGKGEVADYQLSALLMAIYLNGMTEKETQYLTDAMLYSGTVLECPSSLYIDKHSTGGVGDKTSFIIAPIAAACGVKVPMIAGRGLGHTGGTVDKVEAVPGYKTDISMEEFVSLVAKNGVAMIGQTAEIAPADKKLYALRDVTATVSSIPLITASIMSKKLASGLKGIVMDIKTGNGAFMTEFSDAQKLAKSISDTGNRFNKHMMTVITDMSQPLGNAIGNAIEIIECVECLKGKGPEDLMEISLYLAGGMIFLAGLADSHEHGVEKAKQSVQDGSALLKFRVMIYSQHGDSAFIDNYSILPIADCATESLAPRAGYITATNCKAFGLHCVKLGGGRAKTTDIVDPAVGIYLHKKIGDYVTAGESLATIYHHAKQQNLAEDLANTIATQDITISEKEVKAPKLLLETHINLAKK
jgi:pyrimidine-nucleoside phosphorylase